MLLTLQCRKEQESNFLSTIDRFAKECNNEFIHVEKLAFREIAQRGGGDIHNSSSVRLQVVYYIRRKFIITKLQTKSKSKCDSRMFISTRNYFVICREPVKR